MLVLALGATLSSVSLKHIGTDLGIGFALKGTLAPACLMTWAIATFVVGCATDRRGKRRFLGGGLLILSFALVGTARSSGYAGLLVGMMGIGAGMGCLEGTVSPLVAELHPARVGMHMNVLHAFYPAGSVAASLVVGGALDRGVHWRIPFAMTAVPATLVAAMFLVGRYPKPDSGPRPSPLRVREVLASRTFWLLAVAMALTAGCEGSLAFWSPSFIQHEYGTSALVGAAGLTVFSAAMAVGRFGTGAAAKSVSLRRLMVTLAFLNVLVTLAVALADGIWLSMISLGAAGLLIACFWPSILALASSRIAEGSSTLFGMLAVAGMIGFGLTPWVIGMVAEYCSLRAGLCILPAAMLAAGFVLLKVAPAHPRG